MNQAKMTRKERKEFKEKQKEEIEELFRKIDTDDSGEIDEEEFIAGMRKQFRVENTKNESRYDSIFVTLLHMADRGSIFRRKNGALDLKEFTKIVQAFPENYDSLEPQEIIGYTLFNMIDGNGNGTISKSEFTKFCKQMGKSSSESKAQFKDIDTDKSNGISKEEFVSWFYNLE